MLQGPSKKSIERLGVQSTTILDSRNARLDIWRRKAMRCAPRRMPTDSTA